MEFQVPVDFDVQSFLSACSSSGIDLQKTDAHPDQEGYVVLSGTHLLVSAAGLSQEQTNFIVSKVLEMGGSQI